jgi:hypothetical protein
MPSLATDPLQPALQIQKILAGNPKDDDDHAGAAYGGNAPP